MKASFVARIKYQNVLQGSTDRIDPDRSLMSLGIRDRMRGHEWAETVLNGRVADLSFSQADWLADASKSLLRACSRPHGCHYQKYSFERCT
jgi:hypothetical protein